MPKLEIIMNELGYTEGWLRLGVVDTLFLEHQYAEFQNSDDKHPEHYRCRAFAGFLKQRRRLSDDEIEAIFKLTDNGPDGCDLRVNRIMELLLSQLLTDDQLSDLMRFPEVDEPPIQKLYRRLLLLRRLAAEGLSDDVFHAVCESRDSTLYGTLLSRSDLCRKHVQWLAEAGGNRSVRNQAKQMLESQRFRSDK